MFVVRLCVVLHGQTFVTKKAVFCGVYVYQKAKTVTSTNNKAVQRPSVMHYSKNFHYLGPASGSYNCG